MGLEDVIDAASDFPERIQDAVVEVGDLSLNTVEYLGEDGVEALENGDFEGAVDCIDMSAESKEATKEVLTAFEALGSKQLLMGVAKVAGGALGVAAALMTPGLQPAGLLAGASVLDGAREIASALPNEQVNTAQINA